MILIYPTFFPHLTTSAHPSVLLLSSPNPTHAIDCPATSVAPPHADAPLPTNSALRRRTTALRPTPTSIYGLRFLLPLLASSVRRASAMGRAAAPPRPPCLTAQAFPCPRATATPAPYHFGTLPILVECACAKGRWRSCRQSGASAPN